MEGASNISSKVIRVIRGGKKFRKFFPCRPDLRQLGSEKFPNGDSPLALLEEYSTCHE